MKTVSTKLSKWLSLLLAAMMVFSALGFVACANDSGDDETEQVQGGTIALSATSTTATIGDTVTLSLAFADFDTNPTTVDVYVEESTTAIAMDVSVTNGKITLSTAGFDVGTYRLYVKSGSVKSNVLSVTLAENPLSAPTNVSVTASTSKANTVTVSWNAVENDEITYYWIYYGTANDTSAFTKPNATAYAGLWVTNGVGSYDITLSESGTYYFWVKAANGIGTSNATKFSNFSTTATYAFTYASLTTPTDISVSLSSKKANTATVTWTASDAAYYWIYASKTNDTSLLIRPNASAIAGLWVTNGTGSYDIVLEEAGPWYFWVKAADKSYSSTSTVGSSDFSTVATFTFTYTELTTPTNVTATASSTSGKVTVTWTASNAAYYWIYTSTTNSTSSLSRPAASAIAGLYVTNGTGSYDISLSGSGPHYIWVKAANASYSATGKSSDFSTAATYIVQ